MSGSLTLLEAAKISIDLVGNEVGLPSYYFEENPESKPYEHIILTDHQEVPGHETYNDNPQGVGAGNPAYWEGQFSTG